MKKQIINQQLDTEPFLKWEREKLLFGKHNFTQSVTEKGNLQQKIR